MKKTEVVRETAAALTAAEASMATALTDARQALARLTAAKRELGLTGTLGDAAISKAAASVAALELACEEITDGHREAYRVTQLVNLRTEASILCPDFSQLDEATRAA